jgi:ribulose-bisphosphate carboxylase large chain
MTERLIAHYHVRSDAASIDARGVAMAVEQSVEMPLEGICDPVILAETVGTVEQITDLGNGLFEVRLGLAVSTTGLEAGQLINMLFGNSSLHDDIRLMDADFGPSLMAAFAGSHGLIPGNKGRALTGSAIKPQGLSPQGLADIARQLALGGLDYIKDDHGLANQLHAPFADRVVACAGAIRDANPQTHYIPSVTGNLDQMRQQISIAKDNGVAAIMMAPMISGLSNLDLLRRENPDLAIFAHPALAGAGRIAPAFLLGKLFRLLGADATIFPNFGGRFGYDRQTCTAIANAARNPWEDTPPTMPVPAGGVTLDRVDELLSFYGQEVLLLIGGGLLVAREKLTGQCLNFTQRVADYGKMA